MACSPDRIFQNFPLASVGLRAIPQVAVALAIPARPSWSLHRDIRIRARVHPISFRSGSSLPVLSTLLHPGPAFDRAASDDA